MTQEDRDRNRGLPVTRPCGFVASRPVRRGRVILSSVALSVTSDQPQVASPIKHVRCHESAPFRPLQDLHSSLTPPRKPSHDGPFRPSRAPEKRLAVSRVSRDCDETAKMRRAGVGGWSALPWGSKVDRISDQARQTLPFGPVIPSVAQRSRGISRAAITSGVTDEHEILRLRPSPRAGLRSG